MPTRHRRMALKALAISAPAIWVKPVVTTAVLPAHANLSFLEGLECTQQGSIIVASNEGAPCDSTVGINEDLQATFELVPDASDVPMAGIVLCNGEIIETNLFNSDEGLGTNLNPAQNGCTSGSITIRLYRLDNGCFAECSWNISAN